MALALQQAEVAGMCWGLASRHAGSESETVLWQTATRSLWGHPAHGPWQGLAGVREEEWAEGQSCREGPSPEAWQR